MAPWRKEMTTMSQLEGDIRHLEQRMAALRHQAESERMHLTEQTNGQIDRLTDLLIAKKLRLSKLHGDVRCPACQMINPRAHRTCRFCGQDMDDDRKETR